MLIYIQSSDALVAQPERIVAQHMPLMQPLLAGDCDGAAQAAAAHNESEGRILVDYLDRNA